MIERWGVAAVLGPGPVSLKRLQTMDALVNVYDTVKRMRGMQGEDIHKLSDAEREMIAEFRQEGWL